ncbi:MAG: hypothetical protein K9K62_08670 [Desulfobacteraceae bacterium]|nr:hypothetical protein [Desulfobacteraceae bacterium]
MDESTNTYQRHHFTSELRNELNAEEASKISKRAAKISERIDDVFYENIINQDSGLSHENLEPDRTKEAARAFANRVLELDDELMKKYMGQAWEEEMAFHAVKAEDIAVDIKQPDPSSSQRGLIEYILMRDELAIRDEAMKDL